MYITVTNVCVWLQTVVLETLLEVRLHVSEPRINSQWPLLLTWFNFNPNMDK